MDSSQKEKQFLTCINYGSQNSRYHEIKVEGGNEHDTLDSSAKK